MNIHRKFFSIVLLGLFVILLCSCGADQVYVDNFTCQGISIVIDDNNYGIVKPTNIRRITMRSKKIHSIKLRFCENGEVIDISGTFDRDVWKIQIVKRDTYFLNYLTH